MKLYIYEFSSPRRNGQNSTDKLVLGALSEYCREEKIPLQKSPVIHRPLSGKPMFEESGFHFSVSHSGNLWACLIGITPVGLDIQKKKLHHGNPLHVAFLPVTKRNMWRRWEKMAFGTFGS